LTTKANKTALTLEFPENALLAAVSGPHSKNLARLEQKLDVAIDMRGNLVSVSGAARERAASVLRTLYARAAAGEASPWPKSIPRSASPTRAGFLRPVLSRPLRHAPYGRVRLPRRPIWT
jgi:phosphate starvation-inducible protein PhoH